MAQLDYHDAHAPYPRGRRGAGGHGVTVADWAAAPNDPRDGYIERPRRPELEADSGSEGRNSSQRSDAECIHVALWRMPQVVFPTIDALIGERCAGGDDLS